MQSNHQVVKQIKTKPQKVMTEPRGKQWHRTEKASKQHKENS